jgi:hypothetical protein
MGGWSGHNAATGQGDGMMRMKHYSQNAQVQDIVSGKQAEMCGECAMAESAVSNKGAL